MSNCNDTVWHRDIYHKATMVPLRADPLDDIFEPGFNPFEPVAPDVIEYSERSPSLLELAAERIGERTSGYGKENSFGAICRLWNAFLRNRPQSESGFVDLTEAEVADLMVIFKLARKQVRRLGGKPHKQDDNVDAAGYVAWADKLEENDVTV